MTFTQLLIAGTPYRYSFSVFFTLLPLNPPPPPPHLRFCNPFIGFFLPTSHNIFLHFTHVVRGSFLFHTSQGLTLHRHCGRSSWWCYWYRKRCGPTRWWWTVSGPTSRTRRVTSSSSTWRRSSYSSSPRSTAPCPQVWPRSRLSTDRRHQRCGSGIRDPVLFVLFLTPGCGIRHGEKFGSGMSILDLFPRA